MSLQLIGLLALHFGWVPPICLFTCYVFPGGGPLPEEVAPNAGGAVEGAALPLLFNEQQLREIDRINADLYKLKQRFGEFHIHKLQEDYYGEELDTRLLKAQQRGAEAFTTERDHIRLELECLKLQGTLHKKLAAMLRKHSPSFTEPYRGSEGIKAAVAFTTDDSRIRFSPGLSFQDKLEVQAALEQRVASLTDKKEGDSLFVVTLWVAQRGELPYCPLDGSVPF